MVSRAESDEDFAPSIERFMSLDRNMTSSIDVAGAEPAVFMI